MPAYARPTRVDDALKVLAQGGRVPLAGGTDYYPARSGMVPAEDVLDLTALAELRGVSRQPAQWRIGATTPWSEVLEADLPPYFDCLKQAACAIGGRQIQNAGTVGGNLCNASPAADGVPALLALDARVELASASGRRELPLAEFILGPRTTARRPDELLTAVFVSALEHDARSRFLKLGARKHLVISIAMVAVVVEHENGVIRDARAAVGSCSPVARRLPDLERALIGERLGAAPVQAAQLAALSPIDDVRASAAYRREAVLVLLRRALQELA